MVPLAFVIVLVLLLLVASLLARRRSVAFRVPATVESIRSVVARVHESAQQARLDEQALFQCRLALDEACTNIIEHAYANDPAGEIEVVVKVGDGICAIHLIDFGEAYDPAQVSSPPIGEGIEKASPGGLGLYLMRTVMDEVYYSSSPRGNRLIMVKRR